MSGADNEGLWCVKRPDRGDEVIRGAEFEYGGDAARLRSIEVLSAR